MSITHRATSHTISQFPKLTVATAVAATFAVAAMAALGRDVSRATPILLAAPPAAAGGSSDDEGRRAVLFSADGRSKITITVEDVATSPASAPARYDELSPESEIRHASSRP